MWWIAFSLGLFGSLHCIGMCGPLALGFCNRSKNTGDFSRLWSSISYNLGRTLTYMGLGALFGLIGNLFYITGFQKFISILGGATLILVFLLSMDLDKMISGSRLGQRYFPLVQTAIGRLLSSSTTPPAFLIGMANGLLPCGLVYLALAGALTTGSYVGGILFMALFGLGTLPLMAGLMLSSQLIPISWRNIFRKVYPYATLAIGMFLIYRGIVVGTPQELDFWHAWQNPVMCH